MGRCGAPLGWLPRLACLLAIRNQRILHASEARQAENTRRAAAGLPSPPPEPASDAARPSPPARHNQKARPALRHLTSYPHPARTPDPGQHALQDLRTSTQNHLRPDSPASHPEMSELHVNMKHTCVRSSRSTARSPMTRCWCRSARRSTVRSQSHRDGRTATEHSPDPLTAPIGFVSRHPHVTAATRCLSRPGRRP
jgi:hypothetical protein